MENKEWHFDGEYFEGHPKSEWGDGPWQTEPDKIQFADEVTGLPCLIIRSPLGSLCGYVGVPEGHPLYGISYSRCSLGKCDSYCEHSPECMIKAHGGLTFSDFCQEGGRICHVTETPDKVFWFGFDCAHADDYCPAIVAMTPVLKKYRIHDIYRTVKYVKEQCRDIALQLVEIKINVA